jgi:anaerobic selenocysteine-containing dehydrogenase
VQQGQQGQQIGLFSAGMGVQQGQQGQQPANLLHLLPLLHGDTH